jgi:hypothetical protein
VSQFCRHCGQRARLADRYCVRCGGEIDHAARPAPNTDPFRGPDDRRGRMGGFLAAHAKGLMALAAISAVALAVALGGSLSSTSSPAADAAVASAPKSTPKAKPRARGKVTTGAHGRTYFCSSSVLGRVDAAKVRFRGPERVLLGMEAALKQVDRKYPGTTPPPATADRYNALLARTRAQLTVTNEAIRRYNETLRHACRRR